VQFDYEKAASMYLGAQGTLNPFREAHTDELWLRVVFALPKASSSTLDAASSA